MRGWICFDRECAICTMLARRFCRVLEKRGFGLAALQDPRVASLFDLPAEELMQEMRVVTADGVYGGAGAVVYLAKQIWWAWPIYAAAQLPGVLRILDTSYRWFADHRHCSSNKCSVAQNNQHNDLNRHAKGRPR